MFARLSSPARIAAPGFFVAFAALLALAGCSRGPASPPLALVNGESIGEEQLLEELAFREPAEPADVLESLIDEALILQEGRRLGIGLDPAPGGDARAEAEALAGTSEDSLGASLKARGLSRSQWSARLARAALADEVVRQAVRRNLALTQQEVKDHYWQHLPSYRFPQRRRLRQAFFRSPQAAEQALRELELGEPFAEVASRRGEGPEAARGGLLGVFGPKDLPPPLAAAASRLKPGTYSPVLASTWGWHILYLESLQRPQNQNLEQAAPAARSRLLREKEIVFYQSWLARLRERADIRRLAPLPTMPPRPAPEPPAEAAGPAPATPLPATPLPAAAPSPGPSPARAQKEG